MTCVLRVYVSKGCGCYVHVCIEICTKTTMNTQPKPISVCMPKMHLHVHKWILLP